MDKQEESISTCCCIILNYNDADTVLDLVGRIRNFAVFRYIVVVDNHSTDDSYEKLLPLQSDRIHVLRTERNGGYGAGNNFGIRYARETLGCDRVLLSNPDVYFSEELVEHLLETLDDTTAAAAVTAIQHNIHDEPIEDVAWRLPTAWQYAVMGTRFGGKLASTRYDEPWLRAAPIRAVDCLPGAFVLYDADKFCEVGGYDEQMFLFCEETTIGYKLKHAGYVSLICTDRHYRHAHSVSINKSIQSQIKQKEMVLDNRRLFMKKYLHAGPITMTVARILHRHILKSMEKQSS